MSLLRIANDPLSYEQSEFNIAAGRFEDVNVAGDFFYIDALSAPILLSVNGRKPALVRVAATMQGAPGANQLSLLRFTNNTGSAVTGRVIHGRGVFTNSGNVVIQNPTFSLDAAAINALIGTGIITPAIKFLNDETDTAVAPRSWSVQNTGGVDITVTVGATPYTLPAGSPPLSFAVNALGLRYPNIQVNATGGAATFIYEL